MKTATGKKEQQFEFSKSTPLVDACIHYLFFQYRDVGSNSKTCIGQCIQVVKKPGKFVFGLFLIAIVVIIWVASSALIQVSLNCDYFVGDCLKRLNFMIFRFRLSGGKCFQSES
jgi:hypothetical protein